MSPWWVKAPVPSLCFPRVSGDEPKVQQARVAAVSFSPRERGRAGGNQDVHGLACVFPA